MALSLSLHVAQSRVKERHLSVFAQGAYPAEGGGYVSGWSRQLLQDVWQEPVGMNLMLKPRCVEEAWNDTFTGEYARLSFADFGLTEGTDGWRKGGINPCRLARDNGTGGPKSATASFGGDRGFVFEFHATSKGTSNVPLYDIGIGATTVETADVALRFFPGNVQVWRAGQLYDEGSCGAVNDDFNRFLILPMNLRELLVFSLTNNEGFIVVFDDVTEETAAPRILPDSPFWFNREEGLVDVEIAPARFKTTGAAWSTRGALAQAPSGEAAAETPEAFRRIEMGGTVTPSLSNIEATGGYDRATEAVRLKVALTGPGGYTPFVQGALGGFAPVMADTAGPEVELRERAMEVQLSVCESPTDASLSFAIIGKEDGADDEIWELEEHTNLPLAAKFDGLEHPFYVGQSGPTPVSYGMDDGCRRLEASFRDEWALLETRLYRDPYPLDGLNLKTALTRVLAHGGVTSIDIEDTGVVLELTEGAAKGEFSEMARAGDSCADVVRRLLETYAATWIYGFFPTDTGRKFRAGSPDGHFGTTPVETLYASTQASVDAGHSEDPGDANAAWRFVYRNFRRTKLRIEANEVLVAGYDKKAHRVIESRYFDADSANPGLAAGERPDNWEGELITCGIRDRRIGTQAMCDRACGIVAGRLARRREVCQFESELVKNPSTGQPLWRGDVIELDGKGIWRINTIDIQWIVSEPDGRPWGNPMRRCKARYTAIKGAGSCLGTASLGTSLKDIRAAHDERCAERSRVRERSDFLLSRPVAKQSVATLLTA